LACNQLADIYFSLGEKELAQDALQESLQIYQEFSPWASGLVSAHQIKHSLGFGEIEPAIEWLGGIDINANSPIDLSRDVEFLTLARVLIAQKKLDEGLALLKRISEVSDEIGKKHTSLRAIILQAIVLFLQEDIDKAMDRIELALTLSEAGEYIQIFVDEGPPMARLLYEAFSRDISPEYVQKLLAAFPDVEPEKDIMSKPFVSDSEWIEPLSEREIEVLQLIAEGLSRQEIASELFLTLNTVKTHARNIYSKLGVNNQMQAVGKARGLGLLDMD
jgi:LuxR family maltose regulon positive regulatory protein